MARYPRLILPGVALHIIQRGNNRNACFREDSDYLTYLAHLRHLSRKYECDVHAYCLMTNHVHLLLTPDAPDACGLLMRDLGRCYVRYFNRRHARTGTLWEGRFRSCIVESAEYVLACYRYIELNPVRAGMVGRASGHPWSSHAANSGMRADPMVKPHCEFAALTADAYRGLFEQPFEQTLLQSIREATNGGYPLASDSYKSSVIAPAGYRTGRGKPGPRVESPDTVYCCEPG
jgi:REP-associated tyrosine transposase